MEAATGQMVSREPIIVTGIKTPLKSRKVSDFKGVLIGFRIMSLYPGVLRHTIAEGVPGNQLR